MHVEVDVGSSLDQLSGITLVLLVAAARDEREQLLNFLRRRSAVGAGDGVARHDRSVGVEHAAVDERRPVRQRVDDVEARVVHDAGGARTDLECLDVHVGLERRLDEEVGDGHFAFSRDLEVDRHLDHGVRLAVRPAGGERRQAWKVRVIAFGRAGVDPCVRLRSSLNFP